MLDKQLTFWSGFLGRVSQSAMSRDILMYALSKLAPGLAGLLSVLLFVRAVGLDEYGKFAFWFALVSMVASFCGGWLNQAQLRFASSDQEQRQLSRNAVVIATLISVVVLECSIFLARWWKTGTITLDTALFAYGLAGAAMVVHAVRLTALQVNLQSRRVLTLEFLRGVMGLLIPLAVVYWLFPTHVGLLTGLSIGYFLALGQSWLARNQSSESVPLSFAKARALLQKYWRYGWRLSVWAGILAAFPFVDRFIIEYFLGYAATGQYAALYDLIVRSYSLLFFPVVLAVHPRIMVAANSGQIDESRRLIRQAVAVQLVLFVPVFLVILFGGMTLVGMVLPQSPDVSLGMVLLLALSGFLWQVALLTHKPLEISGRLELMLLALTFSLLVNAAIGAWGAPRFGLIAFAVANVVASSCYVISCIVFARSSSRTHP